MNTIGKLALGIVAGYILAIIIGAALLQVELFHDGLLSLGIGKIGATYFFGGLLASLALLAMAPSNSMRFKLIGLYPVAIIIVGSIGLQGIIGDSAGTVSAQLADPTRMVKEMAAMVASLIFWLTPLVVTAGYAFQVSNRPRSVSTN